MMPDPYDALNVDTNATQDEIKRAYRDAANAHHPDRGGDPEKFSQAATAYRIIGDEQTRKKFDAGDYCPDGHTTRKEAIEQLCEPEVLTW